MPEASVPGVLSVNYSGFDVPMKLIKLGSDTVEYVIVPHRPEKSSVYTPILKIYGPLPDK